MRVVTALLTCWIVSQCLAGCSSDDDSETPEQHEQPAVCKEISEACHAVDDGTPGPAHDCHELAHTATAETCETQKASCIAECQAAAADAGIDASGHDASH